MPSSTDQAWDCVRERTAPACCQCATRSSAYAPQNARNSAGEAACAWRGWGDLGMGRLLPSKREAAKRTVEDRSRWARARTGEQITLADIVAVKQNPASPSSFVTQRRSLRGCAAC